MNLRDLPKPARTLAAAITAAVDAARAAHADDLRVAAADLAAFDATLAGTVLGEVLRRILEDLHPDGLDGDDLRAVLADCARRSLPWLPELDPEVLLVVLAGALGVHPEEADGITRPKPQAVALHAPVLIADLLPRRSLEVPLVAAFAEIARAETMEAP